MYSLTAPRLKVWDKKLSLGFFWDLSAWFAGGWLLPGSSHGLPSVHVCILIPSSHKDTSHIGLRPHFVLLSPSKGLSPNTVTVSGIVVKTSCGFWRDTIQPIIVRMWGVKDDRRWSNGTKFKYLPRTEDRKKEMSRQGGEHAPEELMSHLERESHLSLRRCCHKRTMASFSDF